MVLREPHLHQEPALPLQHLTDRPAAHRPDRVEHLRRVDAVARDFVAADAHPQVRQAGRLFELHVGRAGDAADDADDLGSRPVAVGPGPRQTP